MNRLVLLLLVTVPRACCYPTGAPEQVCDSMLPSHGVSAQTTAFPYEIRPSPNVFCPADSVNITLAGVNGMKFKGFLCQVRIPGDTITRNGVIQSADNTPTKQRCQQKALTHADGNEKTSVTFTWTPDSTNDDVDILCTVVKQKDTFWVKGQVGIAYAGSNRCGTDGHAKGLPTACSTNETCDDVVTSSVCDISVDSDGECVCPSNMKYAHPAHTYCSSKSIGDECSSDEDCNVASLACSGGKCVTNGAFKTAATSWFLMLACAILSSRGFLGMST